MSSIGWTLVSAETALLSSGQVCDGNDDNGNTHDSSVTHNWGL